MHKHWCIDWRYTCTSAFSHPVPKSLRLVFNDKTVGCSPVLYGTKLMSPIASVSSFSTCVLTLNQFIKQHERVLLQYSCYAHWCHLGSNCTKLKINYPCCHTYITVTCTKPFRLILDWPKESCVMSECDRQLIVYYNCHQFVHTPFAWDVESTRL